MGSAYPELDKQRRMLKILHRLIAEERERGEVSLRLVLSPWEGGGLPVWGRADGTDVAEELGVSAAEAVGLFRRLDADGFITWTTGTGDIVAPCSTWYSWTT